MKTLISFSSVLAALTGIAILSSITPSTVFAQTACYVPGSGTMYRIKEPKTPAQCTAGHVEFQLAPSTSAKPVGGGSGGGLPTNAAGAYDFSNINGFVAVGTDGVGNYPITGPGRRVQWTSINSSFRSGVVDGSQWDSPNVGYGSAAFGKNVIASGNYAMAFGWDAQATGSTATAIGLQTVASGANSFAAGYASLASAPTSMALGTSALATGGNSIALGFHANSSGSQSVAIGNNATTNSLAAIAIGNGAFASASGAMALGSTTASGTGSTSMGHHANTMGMAGAFLYGDQSTTTDVYSPVANSFTVRAQHFWLGTTSTPTATAGRLLETSTGAYLSSGGTWTNTSDVAKKHGFQSVDGEDLLTRIESMPVSTWTYNSESNSVRHMGPTAQDFRKAFGLGDTDKAIATVDADGVSLAAVKALLQRTTNLRKENDELRSVLADLTRRLAELEAVRR